MIRALQKDLFSVDVRAASLLPGFVPGKDLWVCAAFSVFNFDMCEVWALGKAGCHRGTWQTSKWLQRAERSEAVTEGLQPKTRRGWTTTKRGTNVGYVMSWHWPSRKQTDLAMRRNSSGDKTEETWKAGERADGIRLASQRWQSLSVCVFLPSKRKLRHCSIAWEHDLAFGRSFLFILDFSGWASRNWWY